MTDEDVRERQAMEEVRRQLQAMMPSISLRYFEVGQRQFCWNTERIGGPHPWRAMEYAPCGPGARSGKATQWKLVREVNCATRKAAKARAWKWYQKAKGAAE